MSTSPLTSLHAAAPSTASATQASAASKATTQNTTTALLGQVSPALAKAHERLLAQSLTASASISQLGQYKATVSSLATSASDLASVGADTASADVLKKAARFVATFNEAIQQAKAGNDGGTLAPQTGASPAIAASRRTLSSSDAPRSQLAQLGLQRQPDGTLKLDAATLQKSLAANPAASSSALSQLSKTLARRAESELSDKGRLAQAGTQSNAWAKGLSQQQSALVTAARQIAQGQAASSSEASTTGLGSAGIASSGSSWATRLALQRYSAG